MKRKGLKKMVARGHGAGLVKARRVKGEMAAVRRLATQLEQEAQELGRTAAILRRRAG